MIAHRSALSLPLFLAALLAAGCSGGGDNLPREAVSGTVTIDGQPLAGGMIQFTPRGGGAGSAVGGGSVIEEGRFSIPRESGLVPGSYAVAINASARGPEARTKGRLVKGSGLAKESIPARYNARTELSAEIKKGGAHGLEFQLKSN
jgi:hypothetical protein